MVKGDPEPDLTPDLVLRKLITPDLRSVFLRGLNRFDVNEEDFFPAAPVSKERRDPGEKNEKGELLVRTEAGEFQGDNVGGHEHKFYGGGAKGKTRANHNGIGSENKELWHGSDHAQNNSRTTNEREREENKKPSGETRPKNVSVFYYIKIN